VADLFGFEGAGSKLLRDNLILQYVGLLLTFLGLIRGLVSSFTDPRYLAGHCHGCGYDLTGNISGTCPECGQKTDAQAAPKK
jgi:rRNA maturation endonuclease Nob1